MERLQVLKFSSNQDVGPCVLSSRTCGGTMAEASSAS